ncbi:MAG: hypothetical protein QXF26_01205, partial [Candidatus Bathyarchaeia archaeon]
MSSGKDVNNRLKELKERAKELVSKTSNIGPDVDLSKLRFEPAASEGISKDLVERASTVGIDLS